MGRFFKLKERNTSVRTEFIAGMTTFFAMVYILMEGVVFILLTVTGLRKKIFDSLPDAVRVAIPGGIGALCGTSTVTTFSETNAGVAAGGRSGLTSVFCGLFFFVAMFLSPIA